MGGSQEAANKALVRTFFDALSRADVEAVRELYAEDFELWTAGTLPFSGTSNKAQALEGMRGILSIFPEGLDFSIDAMTAEGERVAVEAKSEGVHTSGARYHNRYHFLLVVRDGRITELKEYLDTEHAREVLAGGSAAAAAAGGDDR
jgi:ketosteroid isomerase-like protein